LTAVLAFGSYLVAERLHVSGVLAVVAAGLMCGNLGPQGMSPTTRIVLFNFWEFVAFLANSLVFLLIGLQIYIPDLIGAWQPIVAAIAAVLLARAVITYGLGWLANRFVEPIPWRWVHVLNWGGLRGAISLALALSLPAALGTDRDLIRFMAFGVVLFTLLVQGTTMKSLLRRLQIITRDPVQTEFEIRHARLMAYRAAAIHLDKLHGEGFLSEHAWEILRPELHGQTQSLAVAARELLRANPALAEEELERARRELSRAQRSALLGLQRDGIISEEVLEALLQELDPGVATSTEDAGQQPQAGKQTPP
jgi:CPA1 family monovalent cation:H+ antiporter